MLGEAVKGVVSSDTQQVKATYQEIDNTPPRQNPIINRNHCLQ